MEMNPEASHDRTPSRTKMLTFVSFGHFINDGMVFFIPVIAAILAKHDGASELLVTAVLTVFYVASAGFGMVAGRIADSLGRRGLLIAFGIFVLSVGMVGFYLSLVVAPGVGSDFFAITGALVAGIGSSFYHPIGGSLVQLAYDNKSRGTALGINGAFGSLGRALYPSLFFLVAALAISQISTIAIFAVIGMVSALLIGYGLARLPSRDNRGAKIEVIPSSIDSGPNIAPALASASTQPDLQRDSDARPPGKTDPSLSDGALPFRSLLNKSMIALTLIAFFRSMAFIGIVSWIPIYLITQKHMGLSSNLGYTVTIMYAGGILGQPIFGQLADRFDKRVVLSANSLLSAVSILAYINLSGAGAVISLILFGFFTFSGFPLLLSLVSDYVPRGSSSAGNALVWGLGSTGGQALGPLVVGLLIFGSYANLSTVFGIMAGVAALTILATPLMTKTEKHGKMPLFG
jgi:MFS family permease